VTDNVLPFGRKKPPESPGKERVRRGRELAADQNIAARVAYQEASTRQSDERRIAAGLVVPARITMAMDLAGLDGPDVDERCGTYHGNPDGDIDRWEQALAVPSAEQVALMAEVTGFPIAWFYRPLPPGPTPGDGPIWICWSDHRGCEASAPDVITERGVLLYGGKPRPPVDTCPAPIPGVPAAERTEKPARPSAAKKAPAKQQPPVQPTLPTRMPEHLRGPLMAKLAARRGERGR
jgi:hypothetical protein